MFLAVLSLLLVVPLCLAEEDKRAFAGPGGNQFQSSFRDDDLIDWQGIFHKRGGRAYPEELTNKRQFRPFSADGRVSSLDSGDMVDWSKVYNKRNFGGASSVDFPGSTSSQFVNWNDYFAKRALGGSRFRREAQGKRFGAPVDSFGNGHFADPSRNAMQFTDWRDSFARNYRSWNGGNAALPAFGEHSKMVNWNDYFSKRAAKLQGEKAEEKKADN